METWEAVRTVRVVRRFRPEPLPSDVVERILHAARRTASSKNTQDWAFILVTDRATLERLSKTGQYAGHLAGAAVAVALVGRAERDQWDLGRAAQNMVLVAWELGVGSVPATVYEPEMAAEILGLPASMRCRYILSFGYPADPSDLTRPPRAGGRKALDEVVRRERWQGPHAGAEEPGEGRR